MKIAEYGIQPDDIYNFDETGFAIGLIATTEVITSREVNGRSKRLQLVITNGLQELSVPAIGWSLPNYIIFKPKELQDAWFDDLSEGWRLDKSENRWTTDEVCFK